MYVVLCVASFARFLECSTAAYRPGRPKRGAELRNRAHDERETVVRERIESEMKTAGWIVLFGLGVCLAFLGAAPASAAEPRAEAGDEPAPIHRALPVDAEQVIGRRVPGRYIVAFREGVEPEAAARELVERFGGRLGPVWKTGFRGALLKDLPEERLEALARHPSVRFVEEDALAVPAATQSDPGWSLDRIDQRSWIPSGSYSYTHDGSGVHAYIIDTGIYPDHPDFGGRAVVAYDAVDDQTSGVDCNGHGTSVAAVLGGSTLGVAKGVTLHGVRVSGCSGFPTNSTILDGVEWVTENHQAPAVVNMSLVLGYSQSMEEAIQAGAAAGLFYAVPAGNTDEDACQWFPTTMPEVFTVAGTTFDDRRSPSSNFGPCVDLFAPGYDIPTATIYEEQPIGYGNGTSLATSHVVGAAALLLDADPTLTPAQIRAELLARATPGVVRDPGTGSPNLLLFSLAETAPAWPAFTTLDPGVPVTGLSGNPGDELHFLLEVPYSMSNLTFTTSGGSGDVDLYVQHGEPAVGAGDCASAQAGTAETCAPPATPGAWFVRVEGASAFSGVELVAGYDEPGPLLANGVAVTDLALPRQDSYLFEIEVPPGAPWFRVETSGGAGEASVRVRYGTPPDPFSPYCRATPSEPCFVPQPEAGTWYVWVYAQHNFSFVDVEASFPVVFFADGFESGDASVWSEVSP